MKKPKPQRKFRDVRKREDRDNLLLTKEKTKLDDFEKMNKVMNASIVISLLSIVISVAAILNKIFHYL